MNGPWEEKVLAFHKRIGYDKNRTCDWRNVDETTGEHVWEKADRLGVLRGMSRRFFMYTGRRGIWPLKRPRPGTASRGKGHPCSIGVTP